MCSQNVKKKRPCLLLAAFLFWPFHSHCKLFHHKNYRNSLWIACNPVNCMSGIFQLPLNIKMFFLRIFKCLFVLAGIKHFLGFSSKLTAFPHTNCRVLLCPIVNVCSVSWPFHSVGPCLFCFFRIFDYAELYWFSM